MGRFSTKGLFWILCVAALQACAPLTEGSNQVLNCFAGAFSNTQGIGLGVAGVLPPGQFVTVTTTNLAQSFLATSATSLTTLSLNLDVVLATGITSVTNNLNVDIEQDSTVSTSNIPTSPNGSTLGTATTPAGTLTTQASYLVFDYSAAPIALTANTLYWIVLTAPGLPTTATSYVRWRAGTSPATTSIGAIFSTTWQTLTGTAFDFKVGC
jgi:hypothetical protein